MGQASAYEEHASALVAAIADDATDAAIESDDAVHRFRIVMDGVASIEWSQERIAH